jgi:hypothetical protein
MPHLFNFHRANFSRKRVFCAFFTNVFTVTTKLTGTATGAPAKCRQSHRCPVERRVRRFLSDSVFPIIGISVVMCYSDDNDDNQFITLDSVNHLVRKLLGRTAPRVGTYRTPRRRKRFNSINGGIDFVAKLAA